MRCIIALLALFSAPMALANGCHDLWFTRNLVMDRAGYCFGSVLGQAQFDNSDCVGKQVTLAPYWSNFVAQVQALEREWGCKVNSSQTVLDLEDAWIRRQLVHLPLRDELGSGCLGWQGPATPLYAGFDGVSPAIGSINPGNYVTFYHWPVGEWTYVTVSGPDWVRFSGGWLYGVVPQNYCAGWAG